MDQEQIALEIDERPAVTSIGKANAAMDDYEKRVSKASGTANQAFQNYGENIIRITDRSRSSIERLVASIEKQAETYGKTGVERLVSQRDLLIKRLGDEQQAVDRVRAAYEKMIETQKAGAGGGEGGGGFRTSFLGMKDLFENRQALGEVEFGKTIASLQGLPAILGAVTGAAVAGSAAVYELAKGFGEWGISMRDSELRTGLNAEQLGQFSYAARAAGTDLSVVDRLMRGLTLAIEDDTKAGAAQRAVLVGMGVDIQAVKDGTADTASVLQTISKHWEENGNVLARNKEALDLFKRAGIEAIPFLTELNSNLDHAKDAGFGYQQSMIDAGVATQKTVADMEERWKNLKLTIEGTAASVLEVFTNTSKYDQVFAKYEKQQLQPGPFSTASKEGQPTFNSGLRVVMGQDNSTFHVGMSNPQFQSDLNTKSGLESQMTPAKKEADAASKAYFGMNPLSSKFDEAREQWVKAEANVNRITEALKALTDQTKDTADHWKTLGEQAAQADKAWISFADHLAGKELDPITKARRDFEELAGGVGRYSDGIERARAAQALMKFSSDELAKSTKTLDDSLRKMTDETDKRLNDQFEKEVLTPAAKYARGTLTTNQNDVIAQQDAIHTAAQQQIAASKTQSTFESQMATVGVKDPFQRAQIQYDFKMKELDLQKQIYEQYKATYTVEQQEAEDQKLRQEGLQNERDLVLEIAEARQHQFEEVSKTATGLYHTLFTHPQAFPKQLQTTVRNAALHPFEQALGNLTAGAVTGSVGPRITDGAMHVMVMNWGGGPNTNVPSLSGTAALPYFGAAGALANASTNSVSIPFFGSGVSFGSGSSASIPFFGASPSMMPTLGMGTNPSSYGGPMGMTTPPFVSEGSGGGFNLGGLFGGSNRTGGFNVRSLTSLARGGISNLGGFTRSSGAGDVGSDNGDFGGETNNPAGGGITGVSGFAGAGLIAGGSLLAMKGLMGKDEGTGAGILMGAGGGAAIGMAYGGPIGAGIGAAVGAGIGVGEMLAGVQSPVHEVESLVKRRYGIGIEDSEANKIVSLAQSKYGGQYSVAVASPEVRQMLGLYAAGTGQANKFPVSATTPMGGGLEMQGGKLMQSADYQYGNPYSYTSNLPVAGGNPGQNIPSPGPVNLSLSVANQGAADFLAGNVVTSAFVQAQWSSAAQSSDGRVNNSAMLTDPGLLVS